MCHHLTKSDHYDETETFAFWIWFSIWAFERSPSDLRSICQIRTLTNSRCSSLSGLFDLNSRAQGNITNCPCWLINCFNIFFFSFAERRDPSLIARNRNHKSHLFFVPLLFAFKLENIRVKHLMGRWNFGSI